MDSAYHIRLATLTDLPYLPVIERRAARLFADYGFPEELLQDALSIEEHTEAQQAGQLWVAVDQADFPVAFIKMSLLDIGAHIDEVDVDPDHHRKGIGAALIETVCTWAKAAGKQAVTLTTESNIPWNAPYYARLGFRIVPLPDYSPDLRATFEREAARVPSAATRVAMLRDL